MPLTGAIEKLPRPRVRAVKGTLQFGCERILGLVVGEGLRLTAGDAGTARVITYPRAFGIRPPPW